MMHHLYADLNLAEMPDSGEILCHPDGKLLGFGDTVGNGITAGWAKNAIFIHTDGSTASTGVYFNTGSVTTASWTSIYTAGAALTLDGAFDNGKVINGATSEANACSIGGATDYFSFWQEGANDIRIGTSTGANISIIPNGGTVSITGIAAISGAATVGGTLAVTGAATFSSTISGTFTGTLSATTWTASPVITSTEVTGAAMTLNANSITTGNALLINVGAGLSGKMLNLKNATVSKFSVGADGATIIAGTAIGTAALTLTAGDVVVTSGTVTLTAGGLTVSDGETTLTITSAADLLNLNPHAGAAAIDLTIPGSGNLASGYIDIDGSTGSGIMISCAVSGAYTGTFLDLNMTNAVGAKAINLTGAGTRTAALIAITDVPTTSAPCFDINVTPVTGIGIFDIDVAGTGDSPLYDLAFAAAYTGTMFNVVAGLAVASKIFSLTVTGARTVADYLVTDNSTSNAAMFDINISGARTGNCIDITYGTAAATENAIDLNMGTNVAGNAIDISSAATGVDNKGSAINIAHTGALVQGGTVVRIDTTSNFANADGNVVEIIQRTGAGATGNYALFIDASGANVEALHVATGKALFDEVATFTLGVTVTAGGAVLIPGVGDGDGKGLQIPSGATASPSGAGSGIGSIYYERDAHKLWILDVGTTWLSVTLS